ncbi:MAG: YraN family protein [Neisseriaceae bacterium]
MSKASITKGKAAESLAISYLQQNGLSLIKQNFHSRFGEIDLIMRDKDVVVFVEVKLRNSGINTGIESITYNKQQKLIKTANYYLVKLGHDVACRFDAVVIGTENNYEWLKNIITL